MIIIIILIFFLILKEIKVGTYSWTSIMVPEHCDGVSSGETGLAYPLSLWPYMDG